MYSNGLKPVRDFNGVGELAEARRSPSSLRAARVSAPITAENRPIGKEKRMTQSQLAPKRYLRAFIW